MGDGDGGEWLRKNEKIGEWTMIIGGSVLFFSLFLPFRLPAGIIS